MSGELHLLFVFLDGVGLGTSASHNPLSKQSLPGFELLAGGQKWTAEANEIREQSHVFIPIDATLGVSGLPQSGTGQATLFTGKNAAQIVGRHFGPFPHSRTKALLTEQNIFEQLDARLSDHSGHSAFANAYPDRFFDHMSRTDRWTVTTFCCRASNIRLRRFEDWQQHDALTADLTGAAWKQDLGYQLHPITESVAGARLGQIANRHRFTLFEYFYTDKAGHQRIPDSPESILQSLSTFFEPLTDWAQQPGHLLVITSDHGNIEDMSTRSHTRNPVPLIAYGDRADDFATSGSIQDITPTVVKLLAG